MKKNALLIVIVSITLMISLNPPVLYAQTRDEMVNRAEVLEENRPCESPSDTVVVSTGKNDTTSISLGNREILIVERNGKTDISISDRTQRGTESNSRRSRPFKGNWRGLELGLNNYVNSRFSTSLDPVDDYMELRAARSINLSLNMIQYDLAISGNNIGLVTGLGIEYSNYRFANNVSITKEDRVIVPVDYSEMGINLDKSRLRAIYINVPLLLEFQTNHSRRSQRAYISGGVIGGVNIGSNTRVVYKDNSSKGREKVKDDFYLSPFRYGLTLRAGFRSLNLYANYYPTSLFQDNKGPELYPIAVGFSILGF